MSGREIYTQPLSSDFDGHFDQQIDLSGEQKGTLLLYIIQGEKIFSEKILIQ